MRLIVVPLLVAGLAGVALCGERVSTREWKLELPAGFEETSSRLAHMTLRLQAEAMSAAGGLRVQPDGEALVYARPGAFAPEALLAVMRFSPTASLPPVATIPPEALGEIARSGGSTTFDVQKVLVGKGAAIPAVEVSGVVDGIAGSGRVTRVVLVPRRDLLLVLALESPKDAPGWPEAWTSLLGSLELFAPPPSSGRTDMMGPIAIGGGVLVLLVGLLLIRRLRRIRRVEFPAPARALEPREAAAPFSASGVLRAVDGLPLFASRPAPAAPAAVPPAAPAPAAPVRAPVVVRPPPPPAPAPRAPVAAKPATPMPTPAAHVVAKPAPAPTPAPAKPAPAVPPAREAASPAPSRMKITRNEPVIDGPATAEPAAAPARTAKVTRNSDFVSG